MPVSGDDFVCPKFQPNIFDSSRCHDCLRQKHLHSGTGATPQLSPAADPETAPGTTGPPPPQLPGQAEERDTSAKEDSDGLSVVSSYCDVSRGRRGYEESSLCILSPGCELYICDGDDDDSTDSCRDQSDYAEFSGSISAEDDYLPLQRLPVHRSMTWLDPPPHRPNPRAWMDEARSRDSFGGGRHSGFKGERDRDSGMRGERDRESGYFSLGRAGGARSLRDKSPPPLHRHYERGHPLYSNRSPEPKATIPFRNPNLGLASERQNPEILNQDLPPESLPPPDPYDIAVEVEAQVGPRSPSPTPFKIAESLASSTNRRGFNSSYSRGGNSSSHSSSYQQSGHFNTSRQGSTLQSRSSSPSWGTSPFKRSESTASLNRRGGFDGGGGRDQRPRSPSQSSYGRGLNSGSLPKNFKSVSSSVKTQSNTFTDFKSSLRKTEVNGSLNGRGRDSRTSSPLKSGYDTPSQTLHRKSDITNGSLNGRSHESRNSSPSRGRSYDTPRPSQTLLRKSESSTSLSSRGHGGRSGSPIRQGYDIESQALLRNAESRNDLNDYEHESLNSSPPRRGFDTPSQSVLRKSEPNSYGSSRDSRSSSPSKKGYEAPSQTMLRKTEVSSSLNGRGRDSRTSSPSRRGYETPSQSQLRKTETNSSVRGHSSHDSLSPSPSRRGYDAPSQSLLRKSETNNSVRSHRHSHDSRGSSPSRSRDDTSSQSQLHKTETRGSLSSRTLDSRSSSPSRRGNNPPGQSALRKTTSGDATGDGLSYHRKSTYSDTRPESNPSPGSWRGSSPSLHITSSPSRQGRESSKTQTLSQKSSVVTMETHRGSSSRRGFETRSSSPDPPANRSSNHRNRSPSPNIRTSSQSSMESSESGQLSGGSVGRNREEYAMLADLPKVKPVLQREGPGHVGKTQNCPSIRQALFKPASHSLSKHPSREWDDSGDLERDHIGWHNGSSGRLSRAHSSTSLHVQRSRSPTIEEASPTSWRQQHRSSREQMQPDLLNFKKGWMSKLDEIGEWKKHWFVLTDAGLRYYRDSGAEEKDDLDGEIDLKSCVKVSEFDVEKNYGFQIQTREAVVTLSAMTAGIRRNWIEVLRKSVRPSSSPDLTQLPDSSSDKENTHSRSLTSSRRPSSRHSDTRLEVPTSTTALRKVDYVELSPVPAPSSPMLATQREAGEGQGREHAQWQDEKRTRDATSSQWEAVLSRKGPGSDPRRMEEEIERKWAEFERLPLKEMRSLTSTGSRSSQPANEALQREVASLRQQLECLQGGGGGGRVGGGGGGGGCGPLASCGRSLEAMERAHRQAMDEVQKQHARETRELERDRDRLLREETQATAQVMETLKKAHKEELEREVEKAKRLSGGGVDTHTLRTQQQAETQALQRELSGLSERYSQKCLDLNRAEKSNGERERDVSRKEKEMEQLRKENKDLQARLTEEISRMRSLMTGQGSESVSNDNRDRTSSELEVLLRVKENEVQYLHKEISCLRNELQFLNTEKRTACDRYKEVHEELSGMKSRSEREIHSLKEHLKLAMAALQEGQKLGNSLEH